MPLVQITLMQGRTEEQKARVAEAITRVLAEHAGSTPEHTNVIFTDVAKENWAISGRLLSSKSPSSAKLDH